MRTSVCGRGDMFMGARAMYTQEAKNDKPKPPWKYSLFKPSPNHTVNRTDLFAIFFVIWRCFLSLNTETKGAYSRRRG